MKKILLLLLPLLFAGPLSYAQKVIRIGKTQFTIQSPFKIRVNEYDPSYNPQTNPQEAETGDTLRIARMDRPEENQSVIISYTRSGNDKNRSYKHYRNRYRKNITEFYTGLGFACPVRNQNTLPVYYGNSFNLEFGIRYLYRPVKGYAVGTFLQYTFYSYKLDNKGQDLFDLNIAAAGGKQYYRTDNLGTGLINRIYLSSYGRRHQIYLDLGAYGDYSYSKRLKIKSFPDGHKHKYKYRDGSKFNPFQAGVFASVGLDWVSLYGRYRLTNCFNRDNVTADEAPRLSLGVQFSF